MNRKQWTAKEKSAIRELLKAGFSQKEIGRVLNRSQRSICYNIKRSGGESQIIEDGMRKRISVEKMEEYKKIGDLLKEGKNYSQIARDVGRNRSSIYRIIQRCGGPENYDCTRLYFCEKKGG